MTSKFDIFILAAFINFCNGFIYGGGGGFGGGGFGGGGFGGGGFGGGGFGGGGFGGGCGIPIGGCFVPPILPPILPCCNPCCIYGSYGNINPGMNYGFNGPILPPQHPPSPLYPSYPQYPPNPGYRPPPSIPNFPIPPPKCNSGNCGIPNQPIGCKCIEECKCCKSNPSTCIKNIVFPCPKKQQNGCGCNN